MTAVEWFFFGGLFLIVLFIFVAIMFGNNTQKPTDKHKHRIGNNWSYETYIWKGREPTPYKHYTQYICEICGNSVNQIHDDAQKTYKDSEKGDY